MEINDGGPAFPVLPPLGPDGTSAVGYPYVSSGASLRDWFAITLLAGDAHHPGESCDGYMEQRARVAYAYADEMLRARITTPKEST